MMEMNSGTWEALSAFVVIFFSLKWLYDRTFNLKCLTKKLPGPRPLPLIGNAFGIKGGYDGSLETLHITWPQKYGEIHRWFIGSQCNISISSPELVQAVLSSNTILDKGLDYKWFRPWLGDGLVVIGSPQWKSRRKLLTPAFHSQVLGGFVEVFNNQSRILCDVLQKHCQSENENERTVDISPYLTRCTLDIICETAMGTRLNAQTNLTASAEYANSVHRMTQIISERTTKPWLANNILFPFTAIGREQTRLLSTLHHFTDNVIEKKRNKLILNENKVTENTNAATNTRKSLLDLLIQLSAENSEIRLTDKDLRAEIDTFMFAGHDTISVAASWFLFCMASYPEYQERVWQELDDVFGDSERDCSVEDLSHLKFMDCCVKEALRLYPSAPLIERISTKAVQIGDYTIPAGCNILVLIYGMHRNPRLFLNPSVFHPQRFLPEEAIGRHPYAYIPFSAGPRNCIGQRFALIEEKIVLSTLLRRFKFSLSPSFSNSIPSYQLVLKPLNGMNLTVTQRSSSVLR